MATATGAAIHGGRTAPDSPHKGLRFGLWVVQCLLAATFFASGWVKLTTPMAQLQEAMPWVNGVVGPLVRLIGCAEVLGAVGMILPAATRIKPQLTPLAAMGLVLVMVLAAMMHASRGELSMLPVNAVLGLMAAFVAWGRTHHGAIAART